MLFVGISHDDLQGPDRLLSILESYRPELITLEAPTDRNSASLNALLDEFRLFHERIVSELELPDAYRDWLAERISKKGFEWSTTMSYAEANDVRIIPVDEIKSFEDIDINNVVGKEYRRSLKTGAELFRQRHEDDVRYDSIRHLALQQADRPYRLLKTGSIDAIIHAMLRRSSSQEEIYRAEQRESHMEKLVQPHIDTSKSMHIGGLLHIFEEYGLIAIPRLYDRVRDKQSTRVKLIDAEHFVHSKA